MALPDLPVKGQNPWFTPRNNWDLAVKAEIEGRLSETALDTRYRTYTDDELADALASLTKSSVGLSNVDNTSDEQQPRLARGNVGTFYRKVLGTIRYIDATTWGVVNTNNHSPTGIASVQYFTDRLRVNYSFTASNVGSLIFCPDETIAAVAGIRMGASVGLTYADVYIYTTAGGSTPINPNTLSNVSGNIWVIGEHEVPAP